MKNKLKPEAHKELLEIIKARLPQNGRILLLSLTGSQAFGWANERLDYDIHGIFAGKNAWDWVHYGGQGGFDINLYELEYIFGHYPNYLGFDFFQNMSNPVYLDPKFDHAGLISLCSPNHLYESTSEINALQNHFTARAVLHCYRVLMVQIHFLETRKFELDIFELNKKHQFKMLPILKDAYWEKLESHGRGLSEAEKEEVMHDLNNLLEKFRNLKEKFKDEKVDTEKTKKWIEKTSQLWGAEQKKEKREEKEIGFLSFLRKIIKN